jgi:AhpD family alkylhydroperoxidase
MRNLLTAFSGLLLTASLCPAGEPIATARPVPRTRPEMKQLLEDMKSRELRIPLPELTPEQRAELGERADSYESRLRYHYLPQGESSVFSGSRSGGRSGESRTGGSSLSTAGRDFTRNADEKMTLSYAFKTRLFWIVSRTNNCQYCMGHQEQKLSAVGMTDDEIAALDFDWSTYPPEEQAAFAYARKLTYEPHNITDADIEALKKHYTPLQILEMTLSMCGNNAINRWKEGTGVPQSQSGSMFFSRAETLPTDRPVPNESFLTPTAPKYQDTISKVAALQLDESGKPTGRAIGNRPPLESRDEVEAALAAARERKPRLPLASEEEARSALGENAPAGPLPNWVRLMANFPNESRSRIRSLQAIDDPSGNLSPLLKAQVSWIIARQDRAWYATGIVKERLRQLGQSDDAIYALDGGWKRFTPAERSLFQFARHLAHSPIALTDDDVAEALQQTGPREVVQLINFVTGRAYFGRVTEAAGLPLDPPLTAAAE